MPQISFDISDKLYGAAQFAASQQGINTPEAYIAQTIRHILRGVLTAQLQADVNAVSSAFTEASNATQQAVKKLLGVADESQQFR